MEKKIYNIQSWHHFIRFIHTFSKWPKSVCGGFLHLKWLVISWSPCIECYPGLERRKLSADVSSLHHWSHTGIRALALSHPPTLLVCKIAFKPGFTPIVRHFLYKSQKSLSLSGLWSGEVINIWVCIICSVLTSVLSVLSHGIEHTKYQSITLVISEVLNVVHKPLLAHFSRQSNFLAVL